MCRSLDGLLNSFLLYKFDQCMKHYCPVLPQEYLSSDCVSNNSLLEISNASRSRSILNMAECSQRKLVTALSQHVTYGRSKP